MKDMVIEQLLSEMNDLEIDYIHAKLHEELSRRRVVALTRLERLVQVVTGRRKD